MLGDANRRLSARGNGLQLVERLSDQPRQVSLVGLVIGRHLDLPVASISPEDAAEHFAWMASFLAADSPASSALTRELLGWQPAQPGLIADLDEGHYFQQARPAAA